MWERTTYSIKCPRSDCEHFQTDARENPCLGCTCNQWVEGVNRAFRYKPTGMPERKERKDETKKRDQHPDSV